MIEVPSVYLYSNGATPVKESVRFVLVPRQISLVPDIAAVGNGITVTTAAPAPDPAQLASLIVVIP